MFTSESSKAMRGLRGKQMPHERSRSRAVRRSDFSCRRRLCMQIAVSTLKFSAQWFKTRGKNIAPWRNSLSTHKSGVLMCSHRAIVVEAAESRLLSGFISVRDKRLEWEDKAWLRRLKGHWEELSKPYARLDYLDGFTPGKSQPLLTRSQVYSSRVRFKAMFCYVTIAIN